MPNTQHKSNFIKRLGPSDLTLIGSRINGDLRCSISKFYRKQDLVCTASWHSLKTCKSGRKKAGTVQGPECEGQVTVIDSFLCRTQLTCLPPDLPEDSKIWAVYRFPLSLAKVKHFYFVIVSHQ